MLCQFLRARFNYIETRAASGLEHEKFCKLSEESAALLSKKLKHYTLSLPESSDIMTLCADTAALTEDARDQCFACVTEALQVRGDALHASEAKPACKSQSNGWLENYLTQSHWDVLRNPKLEVQNKLYVMAEVIAGLGITHASEKTFSCATAVVIAAQPQLSEACIQASGGPEALQMVRTLKDQVHVMVANSHGIGLTQYPRLPQDLAIARRDLYEKMYSKEPPAPCPLDSMVLARLKAAVPCRRTKATVQRSVQAAPQKSEELLLRLLDLVQGRHADPAPPSLRAQASSALQDSPCSTPSTTTPSSSAFVLPLQQHAARPMYIPVCVCYVVDQSWPNSISVPGRE